MSIGVTSIIAPLGVFPVVEDTSLKGGYQAAASTVDRDAIPTGSRKVGMLVYTIATEQFWLLSPGITNGDWVEVFFTTTGTTAQRPASATTGKPYVDTTLGKPIWKLGANWIDATGAVV
jgi:hypothetical protein